MTVPIDPSQRGNWGAISRQLWRPEARFQFVACGIDAEKLSRWGVIIDGDGPDGPSASLTCRAQTNRCPRTFVPLVDYVVQRVSPIFRDRRLPFSGANGA